jgi:hypothetical protein
MALHSSLIIEREIPTLAANSFPVQFRRSIICMSAWFFQPEE